MIVRICLLFLANARVVPNIEKTVIAGSDDSLEHKDYRVEGNIEWLLLFFVLLGILLALGLLVGIVLLLRLFWVLDLH